MTETIAGPSASIGEPTGERSIARRLGWILLVFVATRAMMVIVGVLTIGAIADRPIRLVDIYELGLRWDAVWYVGMIENGYSEIWPHDTFAMTNYAFFPVYPLAVRGLIAVTGLPTVAAGLIVANLCFVAALWLIMRHVEALGFSATVERAIVAVLCLLPGGYAFSAIYTESTFMMLLAATMLAIRLDRPWLAAATAATLSATRSIGVLVAVYAVARHVERHGRDWLGAYLRDPRQALPIVCAPVGLVFFWWFCWQATGDAFAQMSSAKAGWGWTVSPPGTNLWFALTSRNVGGVFFAASSLVASTLVVALLRMRLWSEAIFCAACFLLYWSGTTSNSLLRYAIVLFPLSIPLARLAETRPVLFATVVATLAMLGGMLTAAWTLGRGITI